MQPHETTILDLGCGPAKHPGAFGVDITEHADADLRHDLNRYPYPLPARHYTRIYCQDVIEHVEDIHAFVLEVHRLAAPNATVEIRTPHFSSWWAYNDPTHRHVLGYFFLEHYTKASTITPKPLFRILERRFLFSKLHRLGGASFLANRFPARYEQLFAFVFPCENLFFRIEALK